MYLKAKNSHLIRLPPDVAYLSVSDLPKLVTVSCFENEFIFDICCPTEQHSDLPIGADSIELPIVVSNTQQFNATNNTEPPIVVGNTEPLIVVSETEPPIVVSETEPPIVVNRTSNVTTNVEEVVYVIDYKQELQGLVIINEEIPSHYHKMHVAIANTFIEYKYAFMTLESYLIDPHGHNAVGMPDPNGIAFIMQFANVLDVEQYLYALSDALHSNLFELRLRKC